MIAVKQGGKTIADNLVNLVLTGLPCNRFTHYSLILITR